ncbi:Uncharacterised protein [Mycobacteroides abscessus]|nr:Uncharacterised protein [Mycobacteroides abscessus]
MRSRTSGRMNESITARWLLARMAPPSSGTCSTPRVQGRYRSRRIGPTITCFMNQ